VQTAPVVVESRAGLCGCADFAPRPSTSSRVFSVVILFAVGGAIGCIERPAPSENRGDAAAASSELRFLRRVPESGPPEAFTLHPDSYMPAQVLLKQHAASLWNLSKVDELRLFKTLQDTNGYTHEDYAQFHAGYRVHNARVVLEIAADGTVRSAIGKPLGGLGGVGTEVRVSEDSALERARRRVASACSLREPLTFVKPTPPTLMVSDRHRRLMWQATVVVGEPKWVEWTLQLDATSGEVLKEWGGVGLGGAKPCSSGN
jgi:hypothetical protein